RLEPFREPQTQATAVSGYRVPGALPLSYYEAERDDIEAVAFAGHHVQRAAVPQLGEGRRAPPIDQGRVRVPVIEAVLQSQRPQRVDGRDVVLVGHVISHTPMLHYLAGTHYLGPKQPARDVL